MGGDSAAASYIHMIQHLIEKCLLFHMSKEECVAALFKHANVKPVVTSTVWKELEKENREFFEAYGRDVEGSKLFEVETMHRVQVMIGNWAARDIDD